MPAAYCRHMKRHGCYSSIGHDIMNRTCRIHAHQIRLIEIIEMPVFSFTPQPACYSYTACSRRAQAYIQKVYMRVFVRGMFARYPEEREQRYTPYSCPLCGNSLDHACSFRRRACCHVLYLPSMPRVPVYERMPCDAHVTKHVAT